MTTTSGTRHPSAVAMPEHRVLYYGGAWHPPASGRMVVDRDPATGDALGVVAEADAEDVDRAVRAAHRAFATWRRMKPLERAAVLRRVIDAVRQHGDELAMVDALDGGNPVRGMLSDVKIGLATMDYFAGLVTEMKGDTIPMGEDALDYTTREPLGVVARIVPFNHPVMFALMKVAAPLAAGNTVVLKPAAQTPLSALRLMEVIEGLLPPGVLNVVTGGQEAGAALVAHPLVAKVGLIGSVETGRAVLRGAADGIKPVDLELGGKNALVAYPDADPERVAASAVQGMNLTWTAGQSCGATSRLFLHESVHDQTLAHVVDRLRRIRLGMPTDMECEMGCLVSPEQMKKVLSYVELGRREGARLVLGGGPPADERLRGGCFVEPTLFAEVTQGMRIAREEIFGPVLCVLRWSDEDAMLDDVNAVEYGLTASVWTNDVVIAHRAAQRIQAGYVWINSVSTHFLGAPFGGYKRSGLGREECLEELLAYTQVKNVHVALGRG
ncbi:MAG: aldehyde dehydrogenase [Candidatus Rokuibacteriota bacterium]|nr:MAG: aldehyde dehydrogenase [Candidatus Rokubacteria bacterium]